MKRQETLKQLFGIDKQLEEIKDFVENYNYQKKKLLLLIGPPGTGKTSSVYHIAEQLNYEVIEFNSSLQRVKDSVARIVSAIESTTLKPSIILLDEADGLTSSAQRTIAKVSKKSKNPIILTANKYNKLIPSIKNNSLIVWYSRPSIPERLKFKKQFNLDIPAEQLTHLHDYRQLQLAIHGSMGYEPELTAEERIAKMLTTGNFKNLKISPNIFDSDLTYLLDESHHFHGVQLVQYVSALIASDTAKRSCMPNFKVRVDRKEISKTFHHLYIEQRKSA